MGFPMDFGQVLGSGKGCDPRLSLGLFWRERERERVWFGPRFGWF